MKKFIFFLLLALATAVESQVSAANSVAGLTGLNSVQSPKDTNLRLGLNKQDLHNLDSLQVALKKFEKIKHELGNQPPSLFDTTKANILYGLIRLFWSGHTDTAIAYTQQLLELSQQIGYKKGVGNAYNAMGLIFMRLSNHGLARINLKKALNIRTEINDKDGMAWSCNNLGLEFGGTGDYDSSIIYHTQAIKLWTELRDTDDLQTSYGKRGASYDIRGEFTNALQDKLMGLKLAEALGDKPQISYDYMGIGFCYDEMNNPSEAKACFLNALHWGIEADDTACIAESEMYLWYTFNKQGDSVSASKYYHAFYQVIDRLPGAHAQADFYNRVGHMAYKSGNYADAILNYKASLKLYDDQTLTFHYLAEVYLKTGDLHEALMYENKALALSLNENSKGQQQSIFKSLAEINAKLKNYEAAYNNEVLYKQMYDSVYNKESERKITAMQMQYEFGRQEDSVKAQQANKDAIAKQQIQRQKAYTGFGFACFGLVALLLFFVYRNYANQRKANAELAIAKHRAEESEKFKERFLANMSHEIRTPMSAVLGMTNLVLDTPLNEKQKTYLKAVKKSSENLLVILNDILDLSKLEAGKMEFEKKAFDIRGQVAHAAEIMRFKAEEKGLQFKVHIAEDVPEVIIGDAPRLNQILINLLGNAIKFTDRGFVSLSASNQQGSVDKPGMLLFSIKDSGIGMSAEQQKKIFESFVQGDNEIGGKYGGTGLGLAISKTLIEARHGSLSVLSEPGKGSEFTFTLPYQTGSLEDVVNPQELSEVDYAPLRKLRILVAEDNEFNQIVIKDTLENLLPGVSVDIADNGMTACQKLENGVYDMVLMDVLMPEMDGYEATRFIRNKLRKNIPVVALTASLIRSDLDKCLAAGMTGYIPKPFTREELLNGLMQHAQLN